MNFRALAFRIFAVLAVASLVVSTVFTVRSIREQQQAHSGTFGKVHLGRVQDFSFTERSGATVSGEDLLGEVWVAGFIFTRCSSACPKITAAMQGLQEAFATRGLQLVSFTVDPEYDTPEVLREYAGRYDAPPESWWFLTGEKKPLHQFIQESFLLAVGSPETSETEPGIFAMDIAHSSRLALVDRSGKIRGYFDSSDPVSMRRLQEKLKDLLRGES